MVPLLLLALPSLAETPPAPDIDTDPCWVQQVHLMPGAGATDVHPNADLALSLEGVQDHCEDQLDLTVNEVPYTLDVRSGRLVVPITLEPETAYNVTLRNEVLFLDQAWSFTTGSSEAVGSGDVDAVPTEPSLVVSEPIGTFREGYGVNISADLVVQADAAGPWWFEIRSDRTPSKVLAIVADQSVERDVGWWVEELPDTGCFSARLVGASGLASPETEACVTLETAQRRIVPTGGCTTTPAPLIPAVPLGIAWLVLLARRRRR